MISLCVKFKFKLNIYIYLYLCYKKYIQNIIFYIFLLNYFFNLFIILINIFFILYLYEFYMLNKIIKICIWIFCEFNYIILKFIMKFINFIINLYEIDIFDYFFFNFNKLKFTSLIFKYLIIVKIIDLFLYDIITNKEYYKQYYLYLRQKAKAWYYGAINRLDQRFAAMILNIIFKVKKAYKKILRKYKNKRKYKLMILYFCVKFLKKIYKIYSFFIKVWIKYKLKIQLFIINIYKFILNIYLKSKIYYLLFFYLITIIEYFIYILIVFIEKMSKIRQKRSK